MLRYTKPPKCPGGAARSAELTLPGLVHKRHLGSAVHPMAVSSPFFSQLRLPDKGLHWIHSPAWLAHPFDDGTPAIMLRDTRPTAAQFGSDARAYRELFEPLVEHWPQLAGEVLRPLAFAHSQPSISAGAIRFARRSTLQHARESHFSTRSDPSRVFRICAAHSTLQLKGAFECCFGMITDDQRPRGGLAGPTG